MNDKSLLPIVMVGGGFSVVGTHIFNRILRRSRHVRGEGARCKVSL